VLITRKLGDPGKALEGGMLPDPIGQIVRPDRMGCLVGCDSQRLTPKFVPS
jgi:hypothetical protein